MYDTYYNVNDIYIDILLYFLGNNAESLHMFSTDIVFWVFSDTGWMRGCRWYTTQCPWVMHLTRPNNWLKQKQTKSFNSSLVHRTGVLLSPETQPPTTEILTWTRMTVIRDLPEEGARELWDSEFPPPPFVHLFPISMGPPGPCESPQTSLTQSTVNQFSLNCWVWLSSQGVLGESL